MNEILPLALTMMMGPQIITPIILVTAKKVISSSLAYILAVTLAAITGTLIFTFLAGMFGWSDPDSGEPSQLALTIQTVLIALLVFAAVKTYLGRKTAKLPKWMSSLQTATPKETFKIGLLLIFLMPTDIIAMLTVGINLASNSNGAIQLLPFIALTAFIASLPLLAYLLMGKRAKVAMPKVREWMEGNSWVVSIVAYFVFIGLIWS